MSIDWHPVLDAVEDPPGVWTLSDFYGVPYGQVALRRVENGSRYRCTFRGQLIGWSATLLVGCARVHDAFLRSHGPQGGSVSDHGTLN